MQSEAAMESLRRLGEEKRLPQHAQAQSQALQAQALSEEAAAALEEEKRTLKIKINELKMTCDEKEAQRVAEVRFTIRFSTESINAMELIR